MQNTLKQTTFFRKNSGKITIKIFMKCLCDFFHRQIVLVSLILHLPKQKAKELGPIMSTVVLHLNIFGVKEGVHTG